MSDSNREFDRALEQELRAPTAQHGPPFERSMQAAELQLAARNRRHTGFSAAALAVAAVVVASNVSMRGEPDAKFIEMAELMSSTSWAAPSDILLPERQFDVYQDLPELIEPTDEAEGRTL